MLLLLMMMMIMMMMTMIKAITLYCESRSVCVLTASFKQSYFKTQCRPQAAFPGHVSRSIRHRTSDARYTAIKKYRGIKCDSMYRGLQEHTAISTTGYKIINGLLYTAMVSVRDRIRNHKRRTKLTLTCTYTAAPVC